MFRKILSRVYYLEAKLPILLMRDMAKFLDNALNTFLETLKNIMNHIKTWNDFRIYIPFKDKKNKMCTHLLLKLYRKHIHGNFLAFQHVNMRYLRDPQAIQMTDYRCLYEMVQGETCPFKSKIVTVLFIPVVGCDFFLGLPFKKKQCPIFSFTICRF